MKNTILPKQSKQAPGVKPNSVDVLTRPKYLPRWLSAWEMRMPFFAFTSFVDAVDLRPVEEHESSRIKVAEAARPRREREQD